MKKLLKFFGYLFLGFSGLIILAVIVLKLISDEQYKGWLIAAAQSATGREIAVDGPFSLQFGTRINLAAQNIRFSNVEWGSREQMVSAERLFVKVSPLPLLKGILDLTVELDGADVLLEANEQGIGNWVLAPSGKAVQGSEAGPESPSAGQQLILPLKPYIRNFRIRNFLFAYDSPDTDRIEARVDLLRLFVNGAGELPLVVNAVYQDSPVILEGTLGAIDDWYSNRQTPVVLSGKLNEADVRIEGTAGPLLPKPIASLGLFLAAPNVSTFSPFAGMDLPELAGLDIELTAEAADGRTAAKDISIRLNDPLLSVSISGAIDDLSTIGGVNLQADIRTDRGTALNQKLGGLAMESLPDSLSFTATLQGSRETLSMNSLDLSVKDQGVDIKLSGAMQNVLKLEGAEATLTADVERLDIIGSYIGKKLPGLGPLDISAEIISPDNKIQLKSLLLNLSDPALSVEVSGSSGALFFTEQDGLAIENINIEARADSTQLEEVAKRFELSLPVALPASFSLELEASGSLEKLGVNSLELALRDDGLDINLSATAENILDQSGIAATLTAQAASTASLSKFASMEIPDLGPLTVNSRIASADKTYALESLDLDLDGEDVQIRINAAIKDLLALAGDREGREKLSKAGIEMSLDATIASISGLTTEITGIEVPELGALHLSGQVSSAKEMVPALESFSLKLDGDELNVQVEGKINDLLILADAAKKPEELGAAGIDVSITAATDSVAGLAAHTVGMQLPYLGSLAIDARIHSVEQALRLETFSAALKDDGLAAYVEGTIADIVALSDIKASVNATIDSLRTLSPVTKSELPETGPWNLDARISTTALNSSPLLLNGRLEGERTATVFDATIPDIQSPRTLLAKLTVDADSLVLLDNFTDRDLPADEPVRVSSNIAVTPGEYRLEKFLLLFREGRLLSDLSYTTPLEKETGRTKLSGQVSLQNFDITPFLALNTPPPEESSETVEPEEKSDEKTVEKKSPGGKKIFSSEPLAVGPLKDYDVDLKLEATDTTIREGFVIDGTIALSLDRGLLTIDPFILSGSGGAKADGRFQLDARDSEANLDLFLDFKDFVSPKFGGKFNLDADLTGKGDSIAALMGSLDGRFIAKISNAELEKTMLSTFGAGLLSQFNPLDSDRTTLECAIARLNVTDGMMEFEDKLAAQTTEVTWLGGGTINLKTEEIDLEIAPKARQIISSITNIDIASLIRVGGTLAEPSFGIDLLDAGQKYAEYTAFIATGGLSFIAKKAYDNRVSNIDHCERILADLKEK